MQPSTQRVSDAMAKGEIMPPSWGNRLEYGQSAYTCSRCDHHRFALVDNSLRYDRVHRSCNTFVQSYNHDSYGHNHRKKSIAGHLKSHRNHHHHRRRRRIQENEQCSYGQCDRDFRICSTRHWSACHRRRRRRRRPMQGQHYLGSFWRCDPFLHIESKLLGHQNFR